MENSRNVSVGDLIYGSDAYYGQVTRIGGSVVEFTTVGLMPEGPQGEQGIQGIQGIQGLQGIQGIPGEVQKKDLPGVNLGGPDLVGKTDLGGGWYRLQSISGLHLDYNINTSNFRMHGLGNGTNRILYGFSSSNTPDITYSYSIYLVERVTQPVNIQFGGVGAQPNERASLGNLDNQSIRNAAGYSSSTALFTSQFNDAMDVTFKIKWEKGSIVTPYTVPGQIPQYASRQQEGWIIPTLVDGWMPHPLFGNVRYYKNGFGEVIIEGCVYNGTTQFAFVLPPGYRPSRGLFFAGVKSNTYNTVQIHQAGEVSFPT